MQVRLEVAHEKANVRTVTLRSGLIIGRGAECKLRIASNEVSRRHCRISLTDTAVLVRDLGSSNGTFVDGERLEPEVDVPLSPGSQLVIGGVEFVVRYDAPETEAAAAPMDPGSTVDFREASREQLPEEAAEDEAAEYVEVEESEEEAAEVDSEAAADAEDTQQLEYPPDEEGSDKTAADETAADETAGPIAGAGLIEPDEDEEEAPLFEAADEPEAIDEPEVAEALEVDEDDVSAEDVAEDDVSDEEPPPAAEVVDPESEVPPQVSLDDGFAAAEDLQPGDSELPMTEEFGGLIDPDAVPAADEVVPVAEAIPVEPSADAEESAGEALVEPDTARPAAAKAKKKRGLFGFLGRKRKAAPAAQDEPPAAEPVVESDAETVMDGDGEDLSDAADIEDTVADAVCEDDAMEEPVDEVGEEVVAEQEATEEEAEFGDEDVAGFLADLNDSEAEESAEEDSALGDFLKRFNE